MATSKTVLETVVKNSVKIVLTVIVFHETNVNAIQAMKVLLAMLRLILLTERKNRISGTTSSNLISTSRLIEELFGSVRQF